MKLLAGAVDFNTLGQKIGLRPELKDLGSIVSEFLKYLFPLAGLLLFAYLVVGGFSYLTSGGDPKAMEQAKGKVTNAIVGFIILVVAYWVVQIFEFVFKITVF